MAIYRMLREQGIELKRAGVLAAAYELTLGALAVTDRDDPITKLIAEKIMQIGQHDAEDAHQISKLAIEELRN
jgi:hypothetical protein